MGWVKDDKQYKCTLHCGDCDNQLNETVEMTGKELGSSWTGMVMGSGFAAGKCSNGCRSTFSDLNINTKLNVHCVTDNEIHDENVHGELFR